MSLKKIFMIFFYYFVTFFFLKRIVYNNTLSSHPKKYTPPWEIYIFFPSKHVKEPPGRFFSQQKKKIHIYLKMKKRKHTGSRPDYKIFLGHYWNWRIALVYILLVFKYFYSFKRRLEVFRWEREKNNSRYHWILLKMCWFVLFGTETPSI